jgi:hypothetical protein
VTPAVSSLAFASSVSSGGSIISVLGTSFGNVGNFSLRVRIQPSAAQSTV